MLETGLVSLLMIVVGTCVLMVAAPAVCIAITIFCDSVNLGGAFAGIAAKIIALLFVPILLAGQVLDGILLLFPDAIHCDPLEPGVR